MGFEVNMENLYKAFVIMVQGMAGIFVTILVIMAVIFAITKIMAGKETGKKSEQ